MNRAVNKIIFSSLLFFCLFFLWAGSGIQAEASVPEDFSLYEDGEVVGFIGDSITHATRTSSSYMNMLYLYYMTRYPERRVEFRNLSASGFRAVDILKIYDLDPAFRGLDKAVIMLGTNEAILKFSPGEYIGEMEKLIDRLKEDGLEGEDIVVLSPPICDQNCSLNGGRWHYEDRVLEYMEQIEIRAQEWGVGYIDIHTPMVELTEEIQKEDRSNSLTRDCIHPNAAGHLLIAYSILQAQGMEEEPLCGVYVPEQGEPQAVRGNITDFYRAEWGVSWNLEPETLFMVSVEELPELQSLSENVDLLFRQPLWVKGLSDDISYRVFAGEAELGTFTGEELAEGVDLAALENHPLWTAAKQIDTWNRDRHWKNVKYRDVWVEIGMQRETYDYARIQKKYESWRNADQELRDSIYAAAQEMSGNVLRISIVEEGYSLEQLEQSKKEAEERAREEAEEQARREAAERARREAREQGRREAEEHAGRRAEERVRRETEEQARREILVQCILTAAGAVLGTTVLWGVCARRRAKLRSSGNGRGEKNEQIKKAG